MFPLAISTTCTRGSSGRRLLLSWGDYGDPGGIQGGSAGDPGGSVAKTGDPVEVGIAFYEGSSAPNIPFYNIKMEERGLLTPLHDPETYTFILEFYACGLICVQHWNPTLESIKMQSRILCLWLAVWQQSESNRCNLEFYACGWLCGCGYVAAACCKASFS